MVALCRSARRRAAVLWLAWWRSAVAHAAVAVALWLAWWRSVEAHAAVLLRSDWRGGALQKRTPPCCHALAGVVASCRSARRRAVVPWPLQRPAEAHAAVLLRSGWRGGALQKLIKCRLRSPSLAVNYTRKLAPSGLDGSTKVVLQHHPGGFTCAVAT